MKPFSTYPELRSKLRNLAAEINDFGADSERGQRAAADLANEAYSILQDEALVANANDGGPAFPIPNDDRPGAYEAHPGMSLRDWFAGQALIGILSGFEKADRSPIEDIAGVAFDVADAMLKAREGQ